MNALRHGFPKTCVFLPLLVLAASAVLQKPSIAGKSVYFVVTDRFARSGANKDQLGHAVITTCKLRVTRAWKC